MSIPVNYIIILIILTNLFVLGTSRLTAAIRVVAAQGILLGILTFLTHTTELSLRNTVVIIGIVIIKGLIFPYLLQLAVRKAVITHKIQPLIGYTTSTVLGVIFLLISLWLGKKLISNEGSIMSLHPLFVPTALFTFMVGLFFIISRTKVISQVIGYLIIENGIYTLGIALLINQPFLVELGILLDIFAAIFIMVIIIFKIKATFDHVDTLRLTRLKD